MTHEEIKQMWCDMHKGVKMFNQEIEDISGRMKRCENHIFSPAYPEKDMDEILTRIAEVRLTAMPEQGFDVSNVLDFEQVKDKIIPKLINAEMNQELLANRPHMMEADLAIQFMVQVDRSEDGVASCAIDNKMLEGYGIEVDELYQIAMENMERLQIYFRGHTDAVAYLKKIKAL